MYDALLFDLDGTLIDTESLAVASGLQAFAELGHPVDEGFLHRLIGRDMGAVAEMIAAALPALDQAALHPLWRQGFRAGVARGLPLKPGAAELLGARLRPMALVTSSRRDEAAHKMEVAGIADAFSAVVVVEDVAAPKPAPDPYLLAAERLGVSPARCLVFEDSEAGAEAAYRAGCTVVQVPDILPSARRWAHHVAGSLIEGAQAAGLTLPQAMIDGQSAALRR